MVIRVAQALEVTTDELLGLNGAKKNADNGKRYAINLQPQQGESDVKQEQARAQQG